MYLGSSILQRGLGPHTTWSWSGLGAPRQDDAAHRARSVAIELGEYLGGGPRASRPQVGVRVAH